MNLIWNLNTFILTTNLSGLSCSSKGVSHSNPLKDTKKAWHLTQWDNSTFYRCLVVTFLDNKKATFLRILCLCFPYTTHTQNLSHTNVKLLAVMSVFKQVFFWKLPFGEKLAKLGTLYFNYGYFGNVSKTTRISLIEAFNCKSV